MNKKTLNKVPNVPNLRFKDFKDTWKNIPLTSLGKIERGKSKHRPRDDEKLFNGAYPFIQTGDVKNANLFIKKFSETYSEFGLSQSKLWKKGTLCITIAANIADTAILGLDACFPDSVIGFECSNLTSNIFIKYYFDYFRVNIRKLSVGCAQSNLNLEKLSKLSFFIPNILEQNKIINFLQKIDCRIETQIKIIRDLETLIIGIRQQIFQNVTGYFNGMELSKIGDFLIEYSIKNTKNNLISVAVGKYGIRRRDEIYSKDLSTDYRKNKVIFKNTLCIGMGSSQIDIGILVDDVEYCVSPAYTTYKIENIVASYLNEYLIFLNKLLSKKYMIISARQGKSVNKAELLNHKILVHKTQDQLFIVDILNILKNKLEKEKDELELYKKQKAYLLQNMFI